MANSKRLVDQHGQPIGQDSDNVKDNLPAGVQALIETRIDSAITSMRQHNRDDLQDLARDHEKRWRHVAYVSIAFGILGSLFAGVTTFYAPEEIRGWISSQVDKKLTEPMLKESADRVMASKMTKYVDDHLEPLQSKTSSLAITIDTVQKDIQGKQIELETKQSELSKQLTIRKYAVGAKAGSRSSYNTLLQMVNDEEGSNDLLNASLKEIELFYDADRNQLLFPKLVKKETMKDPGYSGDEVIHIIRTAPKYSEAAINTLSEINNKATVSELCTFFEKTDDLRAAARITRTLYIITEEKFRPLEFDKVSKWCSSNSANQIYSGSYDGYSLVIQNMWSGGGPDQELEGFVEQLTTTIESRSERS